MTWARGSNWLRVTLHKKGQVDDEVQYPLYFATFLAVQCLTAKPYLFSQVLWHELMMKMLLHSNLGDKCPLLLLLLNRQEKGSLYFNSVITNISVN